MASWNDPFLPAGSWLFVHDLANCADGTAAGAVALARQAGATGLLVKVLDGDSAYTPGGAQQLLAACQAAGMDCSGWGYIYPESSPSAVAALVEQWLKASGDQAFLLDAEIEFEVAGGAQAAQRILQAVSAVCPNPWYTSFPWPDDQAAFPWSVFQGMCQAFAPQIYFAALAGQPGPVSNRWADLCWNRAAIGPSAGGPAYTTGGPAGWEGLSPVLPVVPIFDLSNIQRAAFLAQNAGIRSVCWWLLDGLTQQMAAALASTPFAQSAPAPVPKGPDTGAALAAIGQATAAVAQATAAVAQSSAALQQAAAALAAAKAALGG